MCNYNMEKIQKQLREVLSPKRYEHTIGVSYTSANMAMRYEYNLEDAQLAGLLHDCVKYLPDEKILSKCKKYNLPVSEIEERNPYLLHGALGAYWAQKEYGIKDTLILDAIRYHTTGRPDMTPLEKIVFVSDYIEPGRKMIPGLVHVRSRVYLNLDESVYLVLKYTLEYLEKNPGKEIDPRTMEAYEYYKRIL